MKQLRYEEQLDLKRLARLFNRVILFFLFAVFVGETLMCLRYLRIGIFTETLPSILNYVVKPVTITLAVYIAMVVLNRYCVKHGKGYLQSVVAVLAVSALGISLMNIHYRNSAMYLVSVFPIIMSLHFLDKKPLFIAYGFNIAVYLIFAIWVLPRRPDAELAGQEFNAIATNALILTLITVIASKLLDANTALVRSIMKKDTLIRQDMFTKLLNRSAFDEQLDNLILQNKADGSVFSLVLFDIDKFKKINDTYGHAVGDKVLLAFADAMRQEAGMGDLAFRYGGDEFALLSRGGAGRAEELAQRIRTAFEGRTKVIKLGEEPAVSAGICEYSEEYFTGGRDFFSAADYVLYRAKRARGRGRSFTWSYEEDRRVEEES